MIRKKLIIKSKLNKLFFLLWISLIFSVVLQRCATVDSPKGGPKDTQPPKITKSTPASYSTHFNSNLIRIYFNEFIKLTNINQNVNISPPMKDMPEFTLRGKSLIIKLKEKPIDTTTYTISLDNCISDITENNAARDMQYVFSTGSHIDSLVMEGELADAYTLKPEKDMLVMLYPKLNDTLPLKAKPLYATKTGKDGRFELKNLRNLKYKIFALKDFNNNYLYDLPNEKIAFLDEAVTAEVKDTIKKDSLKVKKYKLYSFQESDSVQRLLKSWVVSRNQILLIFKYPVKDLELIPLNFKPEKNWNIKEYVKSRDTLNLWLKDFSKDSIIFSIKVKNKITDTVKFNLVQKSKIKMADKKEDKINYKINVNKSLPFDYFDAIKIKCSNPLSEADFSRIKLIDGKDTLKTNARFADSLHRRIEISYKFKEAHDYILFIRPKSIKDIYNAVNDTIKAEFKTSEQKNYGTLKLIPNFEEYKIPKIIQLINERDIAVRELVIKNKGNITLDKLKGGRFRLRIIYDRNNNGRWDTGIYLKKIQPEKVIYYPKDIVTKANWEVEVEMGDELVH